MTNLSDTLAEPCPDVIAWKKRLRRKGPFWLYSQEPYHYEIKRSDGSLLTHDGTSYTVIWKDGEKVRIGVLHDWMWCRYGIQTFANLLGERPQDMWNGQNVNDDQFTAMLAVRNGNSALPEFDLDDLRNISW